MHIAVEQKSTSIIKLLLNKKGIDADAEDDIFFYLVFNQITITYLNDFFYLFLEKTSRIY